MISIDTCGGGILILAPAVVPRVLQRHNSVDLTSLNQTTAHPIIWREYLSSDAVRDLVSWDNSHGHITNFDLELEGSLLNKDYVAL